ncbi:MAG: DUF1667 domain-containing protein [Clostridiales Family XIII bacterium]|jgi:CxxC motif-containing protein|nr:DUF1667 domain-containing protein [Clostridiales Family XIII bacterium]
MSEREIVCTVCPRSCRVKAKETGGAYVFEGYSCKRGLGHAQSEVENPMRMLTSAVPIARATVRMLPVISEATIPKAKLHDCLEALYKVRVDSPVAAGQVIVKDICGTGVDVIAARSMKRK